MLDFKRCMFACMLLVVNNMLYAEVLAPDGSIVPVVNMTPVPAHNDSELAESNLAEKSISETALVNISNFEIVGNTLLDLTLIENLLSPFKGRDKSYADMQRALETLENAYRDAGYSAVNVSMPEQDVTDGIVVLVVTQTAVDQISIEGNQYYDEANIRNSLPELRSGAIPSARNLAQNLRLANENPTRNIEVVLAMSDEEGKVDAKIKVKDQSPQRIFVTVDNTGNKSTGDYRTGVGYQNNNLFNRDHALTLSYLTSPDHIHQVTQLSSSLRLPLYRYGDSVDLSAAYSNTDAGTTTIGGAGGPILSFSGKGTILSTRYNHYLPRQGDFVSKIGLGIDYRVFTNNCLINNVAICGGAGEDLVVHPLTLSYDAQINKQSLVIDYAASFVRNIPFGNKGDSVTFDKVRQGTHAGYSVWRFNGSVAGMVNPDWQFRLAGNVQYVANAVISQESFGLVGSNAVRGFHEREVFSADRGYVINAELYAPELAGELKLESGSLRPVMFVDNGASYNLAASATEASNSNYVTSAGAGLRFSWHKNWMTKLDVARVVSISTNSSDLSRGDLFGHLSLLASW